MATLLDRVGCTDKAGHFRDEYSKVSDALNDLCWDGEWYIRGIRDEERSSDLIPMKKAVYS